MNSLAFVTSHKYLLLDKPNLRRAEIFINLMLFVSLYIMAGITGLIYKPEYVAGGCVIYPDKEFAMEADVNKDLFQASTSDFLYHPPSDFIMLPRKIQITFEKILYCEKFECDSTCISFRRPNMNPVWCPTQGFQDILELPSIAQLNLNMRINFAGDTVPSELKSSNYRTFFKTNFSEIFRDFGVSDLEFKAGVIRFYKRYQFECKQSPLLIYSCGLEVSNKILDGGVRGPPQEFYQPMHEDGVRLTKSASGYSLKIQAVATIHHLSFSGILVVLGMFYISTIICKNTLELFFASSPQIKAQKDADLDFAKHLKSD